MPRPVTVGLDVGGTKILGVVVDGENRVLTEARFPTPHISDASTERVGVDPGPETLASALARAADELANRVEKEGAVVEAVGVGVPGLVDDTGVLRFAPNLLYAKGMSVAKMLGPLLLGLPVVAENDANCAAIAETTCGAASGESDVIVLTLGTGIGGGIVLGGRVIRGANGFAGEVGHMVIHPSGPTCPCGRRGCWERFASGSGLTRLARERALDGRLESLIRTVGCKVDEVHAEHVTAAAKAGDGGAQAVLRELAWWLAMGLANLANALDPKLFVIGGGLIDAGDFLLEPARAAFREMVEGREHRPRLDIVAAALGERSGAIGAALVAREEVRTPAARS
ncbi:MAG TPA: ROK family protein [Acidimicrobiales bacterium]|nr:ROK family protein [Acidimicrobiales bacterium]